MQGVGAVGEESESDSEDVFVGESTRVCAVFKTDGDDGRPPVGLALLGDPWGVVKDWRESDRRESDELGATTDDARCALRVFRGKGTDGVRRLDDRVAVVVLSLRGLGDCDIDNG